MGKAREKNVGWRIDYFVVSDRLMPRVKESFILNDVMGSDHCPVGIELAESVPEEESEFDSRLEFDSFDLVTHEICRKGEKRSVGFITEYKNNAYIEKTLVIGAEHGKESAKDSTPGEMTVYMKNGEKYTFPCWTDTVYCAQFGVNVSASGKYIYAISDIKGLWCYTYDGKLVYKTRYTSAQDVFPRADGTAVCVTRNNIILLDESGKVLEKLRVSQEFVPEKLSEKIFAYSPSASTLAFFDAEKFEIIGKISLTQNEIDGIWNVTRLSEEYVSLCVRQKGKRKLLVFKGGELSASKTISLDEAGVGFCPSVTLDGNIVTLTMKNTNTLESKTFELTLE